jgi:hypothetical protein
MKHLPAFPANHYDMAENEHGLTMRDYFAAKAMQMEMQSTKEYYNKGQCDVSEWSELFVNIADHAYLMADEMMERRKE